MMQNTKKAIALCALAALPLGTVVAGQITGSKTTTEVRAENEETKTVKLEIKGMT